MLKSAYAGAARRLRIAAGRRGLLRRLEQGDGALTHHVRTMFAIHDVHDLASLDLPWWNYRAIGEVDAFLRGRSQARVFEFGSGASTLWLARRAASVDSVEHHEAFGGIVGDMLGGIDNARLHVVPADPCPPGEASVPSERAGHEGLDFARYVDTIDRVGGPFDLVVVDGRARVACLARAVDHLAPDGLVLFDDVRRTRYRPALHHPRLEARVLTSFTPCLPYPTSTALLRPATG